MTDFYRRLLEAKRKNLLLIYCMQDLLFSDDRLPGPKDAVKGLCRHSKASRRMLKTSSVSRPSFKIPSKSRPRVRLPKVRPKMKPPTVAMPFSMTVREEENRKLQEMVRRLKEKASSLEEEHQAKHHPFKARVAPGHVRLPIFREMVVKYPRRFPSKLWQRSRPGLSPGDLQAVGFMRRHAKAFPRRIFGDHVYRQHAELERLRQLQKSVRMLEMLRSSKAPCSTKRRTSGLAVKEVEKLRGRKARQAPNFSALHRHFDETLRANRAQRVTTIVIPFSFDRVKVVSPHMSKSADTSGKTMSQASTLTRKGASDRAAKTKMTWPVALSHKHPLARSNRAFDLRRARLDDRRPKRTRLKLTHEGKKTNKEVDVTNLQSLLYKCQLERMYARLEERPSLVQRQRKMNATRSAEKRINDILVKQGIDV